MKRFFQTKKYSRGYVTITVLVFSGIFILVISSLMGFVFVQNRAGNIKQARESAIQIAEAGLDYYRWFLSHFPDDLQNGTGGPGPYQVTYDDPEGGTIGTFELSISGNSVCGTNESVDITSTGWTTEEPGFTRTVFGRYARPSVAQYAYIINSNVWAGSDREIYGPYHSNGGVRMDGTNYSTVTSALTSWTCTSSFGCSPSQSVDGVFGGGVNSNLWDFPAVPIDFVGITVDLVNMKTLAQANGVYVAPSGAQGYRVVFLNDGTFDLYRVNSTNYVWGYSSQDSWHRNYHIIASETFLSNNAIPPDCSVIFIEDDLWIEGTVSGQVTIASADVTSPTVDTTIILNNNIDYTTYDGTDGLTAIAEENVLIPLLSPDTMSLRGIFIAQNGRFGRNYYTTSGSYQVPSSYDSYVIQTLLTMTGTIVSDGRVGTKWTSGGVPVSGYFDRENFFDANLINDPPPLTPNVSDEYEFIEWREE